MVVVQYSLPWEQPSEAELTHCSARRAGRGVTRGRHRRAKWTKCTDNWSTPLRHIGALRVLPASTVTWLPSALMSNQNKTPRSSKTSSRGKTMPAPPPTVHGSGPRQVVGPFLLMMTRQRKQDWSYSPNLRLGLFYSGHPVIPNKESWAQADH